MKVITTDTITRNMVRELVTLSQTTGLVMVKPKVTPPPFPKERVLLLPVSVLMEALRLLLGVLMDLVPKLSTKTEFTLPVITGQTTMTERVTTKALVTIGLPNRKMTTRPRPVHTERERLLPFLTTRKVLDPVGVKKRLMLNPISTKNTMKREITGRV